MLLSSNTIWYLLLFAASAIVLVTAVATNEKPGRAFALFMVVFGITLAVETNLLFFLKAYSYSPLILTKASYAHDDSAMGNLFSQFSVAASLTMAVTCRLRRMWYFIIAVIYGLIEEGFVALGIYHHDWYRTWITVAMLPPAFFLMELLYRRVRAGIRLLWYLPMVMLTLFFPLILIIWPLMVLRVMDMSAALFGADAMASRYFVAIMLFVLIMLASVLLVFMQWRLRWKVFIALAYAALYGLFPLCGLIRMPLWLVPVVIPCHLALMCAMAWWMGRLLGKPLQFHRDN